MARFFKYLAVAALVIVAAVLALPLWPDATLDPQAARVLAAHAAAVDDLDNLFHGLTGFDAPESPDGFVAAGAARVAGVNRLLKEADASATPGRELNFDGVWPRSNFDAEPLRALCRSQEQSCAEPWRSNRGEIEALRTRYAPYLQRYRQLAQLRGYAMTQLPDYRAPLPWFTALLAVNRLHLTLLGVACVGANPAPAARGILQDISFSRRTMAASATLVGKISALERVRRGVYVYAECLDANAGDRLESTALAVLTDPERSLREPYMSEFRTSRRLLEVMINDPVNGAGIELPGWAVQSMLKPNRTSNLAWRAFARLADFSELPAQSVLAAAATNGSSHVDWYEYVLNPIGSILHSVAAPAHGDYIYRIHDLDGLLLLLNTKLYLRRSQPDGNGIDEVLQGLPWRNPYDNSPMKFDPQRGELWFESPARHPRGNRLRHAF